MQEITSIKPEIGYKFEANGNNYVIESSLSIARSIEATKLELELFNLSTTTIKNTLILAYSDLNGNNKEKVVKFADAAVKIHNLANSLEKNLKFDELPVLRYCALYINQEGEDRRNITKEQITAKINDWQEGGLDLGGFFLLVLSVLPSVRKEYTKFIQDISEKSEVKKKPEQE